MQGNSIQLLSGFKGYFYIFSTGKRAVLHRTYRSPSDRNKPLPLNLIALRACGLIKIIVCFGHATFSSLVLPVRVHAASSRQTEHHPPDG